jgi:hypothetical protein
MRRLLHARCLAQCHAKFISLALSFDRSNFRPRFQAAGYGAFRPADGPIDRCEQVCTGLPYCHGTERRQSNPYFEDRFRHTVHSAAAHYSHDNATDPTPEAAEGEAQPALNVSTERLGQCGILNTKFQLHAASLTCDGTGIGGLRKEYNLKLILNF